MKYDITFHPSWWHDNGGIDFTQDFFDDPEYRMECDRKMRKTLYEHFGEFGIGEKALVGTKIRNIKEPIEVGRILRSFDPCVSCATHLISNKCELASVKVLV